VPSTSSSRATRGQLEQIATLVDEGKLKPIIARVVPFDRARDAFEFGARSHSPGKTILEVVNAEAAR
jgi:NADPH:quinone reductase-like Zn-dependent oxidoreductase